MLVNIELAINVQIVLLFDRLGIHCFRETVVKLKFTNSNQQPVEVTTIFATVLRQVEDSLHHNGFEQISVYTVESTNGLDPHKLLLSQSIPSSGYQFYLKTPCNWSNHCVTSWHGSLVHARYHGTLKRKHYKLSTGYAKQWATVHDYSSTIITWPYMYTPTLAMAASAVIFSNEGKMAQNTQLDSYPKLSMELN